MLKLSRLLNTLTLGLIAIASLVAQEKQPSDRTQPSNDAATPKGTAATKTREEEIKLGSQTAKGGFENEDEIRDKFNNWRTDTNARDWLGEMNYDLSSILEVNAAKPHGEKADVEVRIKTRSAERVEGISIKLVSNHDGFNQIDKRWLRTYAAMWEMPEDVHTALQFFVGEKTADKPGRDVRRQYLDEMSTTAQQAVVNFFESHKSQIVSDLFAGDGDHAAGWLMVTLKVDAASKSANKSKVSAKETEKEDDRWVLLPSEKVAAFFGSGPVQITAAGNLKIGRITMQRKGGDNGRESANMLQFKINPVELFSLKSEQQADR